MKIIEVGCLMITIHTTPAGKGLVPEVVGFFRKKISICCL